MEIPLSRFLLTWKGKVVEEVVEVRLDGRHMHSHSMAHLRLYNPRWLVGWARECASPGTDVPLAARPEIRLYCQQGCSDVALHPAWQQLCGSLC